MILFLIIMICLLSAIFTPRPLFGWRPRRWYRPMGFGFGPMMRGPRMHMHHGPMGEHHGPGPGHHGPRF